MHEKEVNSSISLLDIRITREQDGSLSTNIYRKPTHTDQYLHFSSRHPKSSKSSVVSTLLRRVSMHCSKTEQKFEEKQKVYKTLEQNGYPQRFIASRILTSRDSRGKKFTPNGIACIPYVQGISETISRVLTDLKVKVCFQPVNTLRRLLSQPKDVVLVWSKSNVVYKVKCKDCEASYMYLGETGRRLETRITEHKWAFAERGGQCSSPCRLCMESRPPC